MMKMSEDLVSSDLYEGQLKLVQLGTNRHLYLYRKDA